MLALGFTNVASAKTGYVCGNTDRAQKFTYSHPNLKYVKAYTLAQCRALSPQPELCTAVYCQYFHDAEPPLLRQPLSNH